jgi:hypothetical protein
MRTDATTRDGTAADWVIPDRGVLCEGRCIRVGRPLESEFDAITALRNRPEVSRQFLDSRPPRPPARHASTFAASGSQVANRETNGRNASTRAPSERICSVL